MGFVIHIFKKGIASIRIISFALLCFILISSTTHAKGKSTQKILIWGDSLSAAYGIPIEKGWASLLGIELGQSYEIINGSISGETTQGGLNRLAAALKAHTPDFMILELGANDGLRGIPLQVTKRNLEEMIQQAKQAQAQVILFGMKIPPNYGFAYAEKFEAQFAELAEAYKLPFIPFFLQSIIENIELFQADELHPTAEAQPLILDYILPSLKNALQGDMQKTKQ